MTLSMATASGSSRSPAKSKPSFPNVVEGIISTLIEENDPAVFLTTLSKLSDEYYLPMTRHFQLVLYLAIYPPKQVDPTFPISILNDFLIYHKPSELERFVPCIAKPREEPLWNRWHPEVELDKKLKRALKGCLTGGIWELLWESSKKGKGRISDERDSPEEDGDEDGVRDRRVSENGWALLEWLITFWEKDMEEGEGPDKCSSQFLAQLPSRPNMQMDDATVPLSIVKLAFTSIQDPGIMKRALAGRLLRILIHTSLGSSPPFHQPSLAIALLSLSRSLSIPQLTLFKQTLSSSPWNISSHLDMISIEDLAGARTDTSNARKKAGNTDLQSNFPSWQPPTVDYFLQTILKHKCDPSPSTYEDSASRMDFYKLSLLMLLRVHCSEFPAWQITKETGYIESLCLGSSTHSKTIVAILSTI